MNSEFFESGFILSAGADLREFPVKEAEFWIGWGETQRAARPNRVGSALGAGAWIYAPDFFLKDETPWHFFPHFSRVRHSEVVEALRGSPTANTVGAAIRWSSPSRAEFQRNFQKTKSLIAEGVLEKAVPVVFEEAPFEGGVPPELLRMLLERVLSYVQGFPLMVYGFWNQSEGFLGATPEVLFDLKGNGLFQTMALAGTRRNSSKGCLNDSYDAESLLKSAKDMREHACVVEGILSSLAGLEGFGGEAVVGDVREWRLPTLTHLMTPIQAQVSQDATSLGDRLFQSLVDTLHPTPALGVFPRAAWRECEVLGTAAGRGRFGAPFGIFSEGIGRCLVSIRNLEWNSKRLRIGAGCGVIQLSEEEKEWNELGLKIDSVKTLFGMGVGV